MTLTDITHQVNVVATRSNGRDYSLFVESPDGQIEIPVSEPTYRRALIDFLTPEDIAQLNQWLEERYAEVIELHELEYGDWPQLPPDDLLEDIANATNQELSGIPMF